MHTLKPFIDNFWEWTGIPKQSWKNSDVDTLPENPQYYPGFNQLRNQCLGIVNTPIDTDEYDRFLLCMALDNEEERILDYCKVNATDAFIEKLVAVGISHYQWEARWQMAELLQRQIPHRAEYLKKLCQDSNAYVRKRAMNILHEVL